MNKFITQQETLVPEKFRPAPKVPAKSRTPKRRGRKKNIMTLPRVARIWAIKQYMMRTDKITLEGFAAALGIDKACANTLIAAFSRTDPERDEESRARQKEFNRKYGRRPGLITVPVLEPQTIIRKDFNVKIKPKQQEWVTLPSEPDYGDRMCYFALVMPDNCMVNDGICKDDRVVAAFNVRPSYGDLVVCLVPGTEIVTVRRFVSCSNPVFFDLYEGGLVNPVLAKEEDGIIYGVVVGLVRNYRPGRLP